MSINYLICGIRGNCKAFFDPIKLIQQDYFLKKKSPLIHVPITWVSVRTSVLFTESVNKGKVMKLRTPGKFGHTFANSGNPDETAHDEPSHQDFHCLHS